MGDSGMDIFSKAFTESLVGTATIHTLNISYNNLTQSSVNEIIKLIQFLA